MEGFDSDVDGPAPTGSLAGIDPLAPFLRDAAEGVLVDRGWEYHVDDDGDLVADVKDRESERELRFTISLQSAESEGDIFEVECSTDHELLPEMIEPARAVCEEWNRQFWWPKAYVTAEDSGDGAPPAIFLEYSLPVGRGVSQALAADFLTVVVDGCRQFWRWVAQERAEVLVPPPV